MSRVMPVLLLFMAAVSGANSNSMLPLAEDPSPENTLQHILYALKKQDFETALDLYDPAVWEGTEFEDEAQDNLRDLEDFMEDATPEKLEHFFFTMPVDERPVPESEKVYAEFGIPEAYEWPHLKVIQYIEDDEGEIEESVERVYVMVPAGRAGRWRSGTQTNDRPRRPSKLRTGLVGIDAALNPGGASFCRSDHSGTELSRGHTRIHPLDVPQRPAGSRP